MKFIGQHIYDLISRFRSDVYLEDISTGTIASGGNLGLDSNNKIVKDSGVGATDLHGAGVDGSANQLLTDDGDGTVTSEANLTFNGSTLGLTGGTTTNIVDINAQSLTTGKGIFADFNSLASGFTGVHFDFDENSTDTHQNSLMKIDYDRTGDITGTNVNITRGLEISMNDLATGNSNLSGSQLKGVVVNLDHANQNALYSQQTGIELNLTDGDTGKIGNVTPIVGIDSSVEDGGFDIKMRSSVNILDYSTIATTTNGATTLTTVDADASLAHFEIDADGDITLDAAGQIKLEPGTSILWDSLALTGIQASGETFSDDDVSLMTSAAIDDKINTKYSTSYITFSVKTSSTYGTNYILLHGNGISGGLVNVDSGIDSATDFGTRDAEDAGSSTETCDVATASLEQQIPIPETCKLMGFYATTTTTTNTGAAYDTGVAIWHVPEANVSWGASTAGTATLIHKSDSTLHAENTAHGGANRKKVQKVERMGGTAKTLAAGDILVPSVFGETSNQQITATITLVIATPIKTI